MFYFHFKMTAYKQTPFKCFYQALFWTAMWKGSTRPIHHSYCDINALDTSLGNCTCWGPHKANRGNCLNTGDCNTEKSNNHIPHLQSNGVWLQSGFLKMLTNLSINITYSKLTTHLLKSTYSLWLFRKRKSVVQLFLDDLNKSQ